MIGVVDESTNRPNSKPEGVAGRDFVSWSQLSTFRQCPLKYQFRYLDKAEPEFVASALLVGSSIHSAIELHHRRQLEGGEQPTLDELLTEFWDEWKARVEESPEVRFGKSESFNTIHDLAKRMLSGFLASELSEPSGVVIGIEESLRGVLITDQPEFLGIVDLVYELDDKLTIRDYKTSRSKWSQGTAESSADQLMLYGELAKTMLPDTKLTLEFVVLTKTKSPTIQALQVTVDPRRIERTKRVAELSLDAIATGVFYPNKSPMNCSTCPYRAACAAWSG
jgi:putative RecB family exonuclease